MSNYLRAKQPGGLYFFTVAPFDRRTFLTSKPVRRVLRQVWKEVEEGRPFKVEGKMFAFRAVALHVAFAT